MDMWLMVALVPGFLIADFVLHLSLRSVGFSEAQIDSTRIKRVMVWALVLWAVSGWHTAEGRFGDLTHAMASVTDDYRTCVDEVAPKVGAMETALADLWTRHQRATVGHGVQAHEADDAGT